MKLTAEQYEVLLRPLAKSRVSNRKQGGTTLAYVEAWDVKAHLIRVFGFGGFDAEVTSNEFRYESEGISKSGNVVWEVAYQATVRLYIHSLGCTYTESAIGSAMGSRSEAHDNAIKNAASDALKRAAIYLGTQFGLSLYDGGNMNDVIGRTLVVPSDYVQAAPVVVEEVAVTPPSLEVAAQATACEDEGMLKLMWQECVDADNLDVVMPDFGNQTMRDVILDRLNVLRGTE